jgi:hypothetical protein
VDVESDFRFANVLQHSAFGGRPMVVSSATLTAAVATAGDAFRAGAQRED